MATAVPLEVAQLTLTVEELLADSATVKIASVVPLFPSVTVRSEMLIPTSSLVIVPTPSQSVTVAPTGLYRLTLKFSVDSNRVSPLTRTENVFWFGPVRR